MNLITPWVISWHSFLEKSYHSLWREPVRTEWVNEYSIGTQWHPSISLHPCETVMEGRGFRSNPFDRKQKWQCILGEPGLHKNRCETTESRACVCSLRNVCVLRVPRGSLESSCMIWISVKVGMMYGELFWLDGIASSC